MGALILIPAYSHIDWRLAAAIRDSGLPHIHIHGCSDLVRARSRLLSDALAMPFDRFLFVDSDIIPTAAQLAALAGSERVTGTAAVTGAYAVGAGQVAANSMKGTAIDLPAAERYVAALVAGMGFAAVSRVSVERLAATLPTVTDPDGKTWKPFFLPMLVGDTHEYLSEDYAFWWRLRDAGTQLWLDTSLVVGHCRSRVVMPNGVA